MEVLTTQVLINSKSMVQVGTSAIYAWLEKNSRAFSCGPECIGLEIHTGVFTPKKADKSCFT